MQSFCLIFYLTDKCGFRLFINKSIGAATSGSCIFTLRGLTLQLYVEVTEKNWSYWKLFQKLCQFMIWIWFNWLMFIGYSFWAGTHRLRKCEFEFWRLIFMNNVIGNVHLVWFWRWTLIDKVQNLIIGQLMVDQSPFNGALTINLFSLFIS